MRKVPTPIQNWIIIIVFHFVSRYETKCGRSSWLECNRAVAYSFYLFCRITTFYYDSFIHSFIRSFIRYSDERLYCFMFVELKLHYTVLNGEWKVEKWSCCNLYLFLKLNWLKFEILTYLQWCEIKKHLVVFLHHP